MLTNDILEGWTNSVLCDAQIVEFPVEQNSQNDNSLWLFQFLSVLHSRPLKYTSACNCVDWVINSLLSSAVKSCTSKSVTSCTWRKVFDFDVCNFSVAKHLNKMDKVVFNTGWCKSPALNQSSDNSLVNKTVCANLPVAAGWVLIDQNAKKDSLQQESSFYCEDTMASSVCFREIKGARKMQLDLTFAWLDHKNQVITAPGSLHLLFRIVNPTL